MGLFDKLKKFLFGPFKPARKKRRKKSSSKRVTASRTQKKSISKKKKTSGPSAKRKIGSAPSAKKQTAAKSVKPLLAPKPLKKIKGTNNQKAAGRRVVRSGAVLPTKANSEAPGVYLGVISHYFAKVQAAVIPLEETLKVGDKIVIHNAEGPLFRQAVKSLQINRIPIDEGRPGEEVGLEVVKHVSVGDKVFRLKAGR